MTLVECFDCKGSIPVDTCWIGNEGIMCSTCYKKRYPFGHDYMSKPANSHFHDWKKYIGFTEVYWYCDCGEKKKDV